MGKDVVIQALGAFFGIIATGATAAIGALFKMHGDQKQAKWDIDEAFKKIRDLQDEVRKLKEDME